MRTALIRFLFSATRKMKRKKWKIALFLSRNDELVKISFFFLIQRVFSLVVLLRLNQEVKQKKEKNGTTTKYLQLYSITRAEDRPIWSLHSDCTGNINKRRNSVFIRK